MITTMPCHHSSQRGLAAAWRTREEDQLFVAVLLGNVVVVLLVWEAFAEEGNCGLCWFFGTFENYLVPGFEPSDDISIMELIGKQIYKSSGLIFPDPRRLMHKLILGNLNPIALL